MLEELEWNSERTHFALRGRTYEYLGTVVEIRGGEHDGNELICVRNAEGFGVWVSQSIEGEWAQVWVPVEHALKPPLPMIIT